MHGEVIHVIIRVLLTEFHGKPLTEDRSRSVDIVEYEECLEDGELQPELDNERYKDLPASNSATLPQQAEPAKEWTLPKSLLEVSQVILVQLLASYLFNI